MSEDAEKKPPLKNRLKEQMEEYGTLAITIYFSIFFATLGGFTIAIKSGFEVDGGAENTGTLVVAYAATKALQPVRILATPALTPIVSQLLKRRGKSK